MNIIPLMGVLLILVASLFAIWGFPVLTHYRRQRLRQTPFPQTWVRILERTLPLYTHLPHDIQRQIQGHSQVLLTEKQFIGCQGLHITDEIRLTIVAQAALLLLKSPRRYFARLRSILVYPDVYVVNITESVDGHIVTEYQSARLGESSRDRDQIVLSWAHIKRDRHHWHDGQNVILHEFAHQLDQEHGPANGVPFLSNQADRIRWAEVMSQAYRDLRYRISQGDKTVLNPYGSLDPAEFFAVATETFFEKPGSLKRHHPKLYQELRHFYAVDPVVLFQRSALP